MIRKGPLQKKKKNQQLDIIKNLSYLQVAMLKPFLMVKALAPKHHHLTSKIKKFIKDFYFKNISITFI